MHIGPVLTPSSKLAITKVSKAKRERFWNLMTDLNRGTARAPSYKEACLLLNLDPQSPQLIMGLAANLKHFPWQIFVIAWLFRMKDLTLGGSLLADNMYFEKTLVTLLIIILAINRQVTTTTKDESKSSVYQPTLITCLLSVFGMLKSEILNFCPTIPHHYYMKSPKQSSVVERVQVRLTSAADLRNHILSLICYY